MLGLVIQKRVSYSSAFSGPEAQYMLFKKKICPVCGRKLNKLMEKENPGSGYSGIYNRSGINETRYAVNYKYKCNGCDKVFSLEELAAKIYAKESSLDNKAFSQGTLQEVSRK